MNFMVDHLEVEQHVTHIFIYAIVFVVTNWVICENVGFVLENFQYLKAKVLPTYLNRLLKLYPFIIFFMTLPTKRQKIYIKKIAISNRCTNLRL